MTSSKKALLIETAAWLFDRHGIHATGVDLVQQRSGVSKTTLYKYFSSKDALINAVLQYQHDSYLSWLKNRVDELARARYAGDPQGKLIALFDALDEWFHRPDFLGCQFINASAEFSDADHPVYQLARRHKQQQLDYVHQLVAELPVRQPLRLAQQLCVILDGAIVQAHTLGNRAIVPSVKLMLRPLLDQAVNS